MAELFSLVKIRTRFKIVLMDKPTPSSPASPADQSPAPAQENANESAQNAAQDPGEKAAENAAEETTEAPFVSPRKLAANRRNSSRSTGPRTARGKRRSSLNGLKHGMFAKNLVLSELEGKNAAAEFRALLHALTSDLAPRGAFELLLVEEIAACTWRMRRLLRYENRVAFLNSNEWKSPPSGLDLAGRGLLTTASIAAGVPLDKTKSEEAYEATCDRILAETGLNEMSLGDADDVQMIREVENALMRQIFRSITMLKCLQADRAGAVPDVKFRVPRTLKRTTSLGQIVKPDQGI
jgi:beta-glucosidase-like glycosyl hydrolase